MLKKIAIIPFSSSKTRKDIFALEYFPFVQKFFQEHRCDLFFSDILFDPDHRNLDNSDNVITAFHDALKDPEVIGIIALQGGRNGNRLLGKIDYDLFAQNWKPVVGFSDTTTILNALTTKTGKTTYHGPLLFDFGFHDTSVLYKQFRQIFIDKKQGVLTPLGIRGDNVWRNKGYSGKGNMNTDTGWSLHHQQTVSGTLLGGNIVSLCALQGTPYFRPSFENIVLMLEDDDEESFSSLYRAMVQLSQQEWFPKVQGIVFGKIASGSSYTEGDFLEICTSLGLDDLLIGTHFDFGHIYPQSFFPLGASVTISHGSITIDI